MHFHLLPSRIRKSVRLSEREPDRTISFDTTLRTSDGFGLASRLRDGRKLSSLECTVFLRSTEGLGRQSIVFFPEISIADIGIRNPDCLQIDALLPSVLFEEIWRLSDDGFRLTIGGRVEGLVLENQFSSSYVWDVADDQSRTKPVRDFWFTVESRSGFSADERAARGGVRGIPAVNQHQFAELKAELQDRFGVTSQMARISIKALERAAQEAERRHLSEHEAGDLYRDALDIVQTTQDALRKYESSDFHEINKDDKKTKNGDLWRHQDISKFYREGRAALGNWEVDQALLASLAKRLVENPWLRVDELEWSIVDALTFREVFEFGETVKRASPSIAHAWAYTSSDGNLRKMRWSKLKATIFLGVVQWGLVAAGMWAAWWHVQEKGYGDVTGFLTLGGALVTLLWLFVGLPVGRAARKRAQRETTDLLLKMTDAYRTLQPGLLLSPAQVRAALLAAKEKGAVWDAAPFALLDRATTRDPAAWVFG
jgi:hypothetical protein